MTQLLLEDVSKNFAEVIANLHPGEVVQVMSAGRVVAHLIGEQTPSWNDAPRKLRQPGSAIGTLDIISDDDEHLRDFSDYMP